MKASIGDKMFKKFTSIPGLVVVLLIFSADNAYAYIDPATGSYVFQMLLAGLLGALFALKIYWRNVKAFFIRLFGRKPE